MAEVGRAAVRDPGALLPGGFWAAVAVWLERPQVANKRLCGVRLEARRSVAEPRAEDCGQRPNAGREQEERAAAAPGLRPPDGALGPRPSSGPDLGTAARGAPPAGPRSQKRHPEDGPALPACRSEEGNGRARCPQWNSNIFTFGRRRQREFKG